MRGDEVLDGLTGLIWSRSANLAEFPLTWQEALDFVAAMNRERRFGQNDWRMPNRRELRSLLDLQARMPVKRFAEFSAWAVATPDRGAAAGFCV